MKLKLMLMLGSLMVSAHPVYAATTVVMNEPLIIKDSGEPALSSAMPEKPGVTNPNQNKDLTNRVVETQSVTGDSQSTIIDKGGNLKIVPDAEVKKESTPEIPLPSDTKTAS